MTTGSVFVRDSKSMDASMLRFTREGWAAFLTSLRDGGFDPK
jgi:Domain of unknown function (DUF397)